MFGELSEELTVDLRARLIGADGEIGGEILSGQGGKSHGEDGEKRGFEHRTA